MFNLSIIIPAYNAQNTIVATLDSIYSIGLQEGTFEVIIVDDCSTDNTVSVINEYAQTHSNIVLLCQSTNQRQGAARNRGLKIAKGKYIALVDADDLLAPGISKALDRALIENVDIVHCGVSVVKGNIEHNIVSIAPKYQLMSAHDFCENYHTVETCQGPWAYLYKNSFLQKINNTFVEGKRMEDTDWVEKNLYAAENIMCIDDVIYTYKENANSTMHTTKYDTCADWWHFSYRRWMFADKIQNDTPQYAKRLKEAAISGVQANTTFRRLTRFSAMDYIRIRKRCGKECLKLLAQIKKDGFTNLAINMPTCTFVSLLMACPIAKLGRIIVQTRRKIQSR